MTTMSTTPMDRLHETMEALGLSASGMLLEAHLEQAGKDSPAYADFLNQLLEQEVLARRERAKETRLKMAHLPYVKTLAQFDFSFQKSIEDGSTAQDWLNFRAERAVTSRPHSLNINFNYSTGQGRRGGGLLTGWKGHLIRDWSIGSTISVQSGSWLTPSTGGNQFSRGGGSTRPDATGLSVKDAPLGWYFNPNAFAIPATGTWGNSGRNVIPGPTSVSLNAQASRGFRLGERRRLTFSLQAQNALNTVVVTGWNTSLNTPTYGQVTGVGQMRNVSSSLRFNF
jgi:hypothetical protein